MIDQIDPSASYECGKKPLEIYVFIDPLCPECWALEPILKKLQIEYGKYFSIRHVLSGRLATLNLRKATLNGNIATVWERTASRSGMSCDGDIWFENPIATPFTASIAIKAAELQGRKIGLKYLRKLQELLFLQKQNISEEDVLIDCADEVGLETNEFVKDLHSESAAKAFQCDLKITSEMEVDKIPTLVFFNENIEEEGMKVTGLYAYEVYVRIIQDLLQEELAPATPPPLEEFLQYFKFVATKEIAVVYNMEVHEVEIEMKKLLLKQKVELVPVKYGTFWRYIE
ncbi:ClpXP adapter SpxH family protein [Bacillus pinisoli]|uniref:ClpXP adapter SpxH family protein n=1 Tax=Bacillus pinisoli TaxID=2901866 RepID=UPI001FF15787|nr:ClpXP adapter SpxH family protein [Bacillus pinisoli]